MNAFAVLRRKCLRERLAGTSHWYLDLVSTGETEVKASEDVIHSVAYKGNEDNEREVV